VLENFKPLQLNHGLMEVGYVDHQTPTQLSTTSASEPYDHGQALSVSMTATLDAMGNLVLGNTFALYSPILSLIFHQLYGRQ
jgi:hypothetical protein